MSKDNSVNLSNFIKTSAALPFAMLTLFLVFSFTCPPAFSLTEKKAKKQSSLRIVTKPDIEQQLPPQLTPADVISEGAENQPNATTLSQDIVADQASDNPAKPEAKPEIKAGSQEKQDPSDNTFNVSSDQMIARRDNSQVEFSGNVKVTRVDSILTAESVKIFFNENTEDSGSDVQGNIKKIISSGDVVVVMEEKRAFADKAVYTAVDEILILTGNPARLETGDSFVTGRKITLFRTDDRVLVESDGKNRVQALFNPDDKPTE